MAHTKQTGHKQTTSQGVPATFPHGKGQKIGKRMDGEANWTAQAAALAKASARSLKWGQFR